MRLSADHDAEESHVQGIFRLTPQAALDIQRLTVGDRPQGVAGDCNSLAETHAWFDSRVAHQRPKFQGFALSIVREIER